MCLNLAKNPVLRTAVEDIVAYKHLRIDLDGELLTTYLKFPVKIDETYSSLLVCEKYPSEVELS